MRKAEKSPHAAYFGWFIVPQTTVFKHRPTARYTAAT